MFWAIVEVLDTEVVEFYLISDKGDVTLRAERSGLSIPIAGVSVVG